MTTELSKGANAALEALHPGVQRVLVGVGWTSPSADVRLELAVLLCGQDARVLDDDHVVAAEQIPASDAPVSGTPQAPGSDDEQLEIDLAAVPAHVHQIVIAAALQAGSRRCTFGQFRHLFVRVAELDSGTELLRYTLDHDCGAETALAFGQFYRHPTAGWKFRAVGQGWSDGLSGLTRDYGGRG